MCRVHESVFRVFHTSFVTSFAQQCARVECWRTCGIRVCILYVWSVCIFYARVQLNFRRARARVRDPSFMVCIWAARVRSAAHFCDSLSCFVQSHNLPVIQTRAGLTRLQIIYADLHANSTFCAFQFMSTMYTERHEYFKIEVFKHVMMTIFFAGKVWI